LPVLETVDRGPVEKSLQAQLKDSCIIRKFILTYIRAWSYFSPENRFMPKNYGHKKADSKSAFSIFDSL